MEGSLAPGNQPMHFFKMSPYAMLVRVEYLRRIQSNRRRAGDTGYGVSMVTFLLTTSAVIRFLERYGSWAKKWHY